MTNALIKNTTVETVIGTEEVPAIPYIPPTPARTVYETRNVCAFRYPAGYGTYTYATNSDGSIRVIFTPSVPPATLATIVATWSCQDAVVPVTYPGTPGQAYVPGYSVSTPFSVTGFNLGWNSGARSIAFFTANGAVKFKARQSNVGVIAGARYYDGVDSRYNGNTINYAFYLARGLARVYEKGVTKASVGSYTDSTLFEIVVTGGTVVYKMGGSTVYTSLVTAPSAAAWLEASMYSGGDQIFDPEVVQTSAPDTTTQTATLTGSLSPLTMWSVDGPFAEMQAGLSEMTFDGTAGLAAPDFAVGDWDIPPVAAAMTSLTGEIGQMTGVLLPMTMLAADHPYGEMFASLSPLTADFYAVEGNLNASMSSTGAAVDSMSAGNFLVVTMNSSGVITSTMVVSAEVSADLLSQASLGSTLAIQQVLNAVMYSFATSGAVLTVPASDSETWVINLDTAGSTTYTNYRFNSYALIGGRYFGAGDDGIFELDGDTDDGNPIRSYMHFGKRDFGTRTRKTVFNAYVGASASGNLYIKLLAEGQSYIYKVRDYDANLQQQRFTFGKGLRANYVELELFNENGADFELDSVEFIVADMTRKI